MKGLRSTVACGYCKVGESAPFPIKRYQRAVFNICDENVNGRIYPLESDDINPGNEGPVQVLFDEPRILLPCMEFSLRFPRDEIASGLCKLLLASSPKVKDVIKQPLTELTLKLHSRDFTSAIPLLVRVFSPSGVSVSYIERATSIDPGIIREILTASKDLILLKSTGDEIIMAIKDMNNLKERITKAMMLYHIENPQSDGASIDDILKNLKQSPSETVLMEALGSMIDSGNLISTGKVYHLSDFTSRDDSIQEGVSGQILDILKSARNNPPSVRDISKSIKQPEKRTLGLLQHLVEKKLLVRINREVFMDTGSYESVRKMVIDSIRENGEIHVSEFKGLLGISRKLAIAILEKLEKKGVTERRGDFHIEGKKFDSGK